MTVKRDRFGRYQVEVVVGAAAKPRLVGKAWRTTKVGTVTAYGHAVRLERLLAPSSRLIAVIDDGLFYGPGGRLLHPEAYVKQLVKLGVQSFMGYPGLIRRAIRPSDAVCRVYNVTVAGPSNAGATRSPSFPVAGAASDAVDGIAIHASVGVDRDDAMLANLGLICEQARGLGIPAIAAIYNRALQSPEPQRDNLRAARLALELGADIVKVPYLDEASFARSVEACDPLPVFVAGGPAVSDDHTIRIARQAMHHGAAGLTFGRSLVYSHNLDRVVCALQELVQARE